MCAVSSGSEQVLPEIFYRYAQKPRLRLLLLYYISRDLLKKELSTKKEKRNLDFCAQSRYNKDDHLGKDLVILGDIN